MATKRTRNNETTTSNKVKALGFINVGKRVSGSVNEDSSYFLSPLFGITITEEPAKKRLDKNEKALYDAIVEKIEALKAEGGAGKSHSINLELELFIPSDEESKDEVKKDFDL